MTKVYIASSCFNLSEAVCREGLGLVIKPHNL